MEAVKSCLIVGAGLAGAVLARELAEAGLPVQVIEARDHVGGNCFTARDPDTGIMVHTYGPHIFHTSDPRVWDFVQRFGTWVPFVNRVKAHTGTGIFSLPINLHTINQFFGKTLNPAGAKVFLERLADNSIREPANFEERALRFVGRELYEAFFRGYTIKQWGCEPTELPADILKRLPVRFNYDDNYYDCPFQAVPLEGYTKLIANLLTHPRVKIRLNTPWCLSMRHGVDHVFYSGALDEFFGYCEGRLGYRTVFWESETFNGDIQGNALMNYTKLEVPWTRVLEHKHFAPWERYERTRVSWEYSRETAENDIPFYPKRLKADIRTLKRYIKRAKMERELSFIGRLGTYRYLDMDQVIAETLLFARSWLKAKEAGESLPVFSGKLT
jgi:UDP-galactopyranose mutase